ncbi:hypothetical protein [Paenibacillus sp. YIM B09110]|uniref:hypothetical protein n=1 Tax=Paenibacillus sp. YIM B09110 TaxID=3126102 RepID=UPI00301D7D86
MDYNNQPQVNPYNGGYNPNQEVSPVISVKDWLLQMLILIIPIVNIIMMFVWAFGEGNPTKKNYYKAYLLWALIWSIISVIFLVLFLGAFIAAFSEASTY